jgi:hypothetical protein
MYISVTGVAEELHRFEITIFVQNSLTSFSSQVRPRDYSVPAQGLLIMIALAELLAALQPFRPFPHHPINFEIA